MKLINLVILLIAVFGLGQCAQQSQPNLSTKPVTPTNQTTANPSTTPSFSHGLVYVKSINFRTSPSNDAPLVAKHPSLYWRTEFNVLEENGDWSHIRLDDGTEGWLRRIYEGKSYIIDFKQSMLEEYQGQIPLGSEEFLSKINQQVLAWDKNAHLAVLCGEDGALDGRCHHWIAFFQSTTKPQLKFYCAYDRNGITVEEWQKNWKVNGSAKPVIAPEPTWWRYEGSEPKAGFISSAALCTDENLTPILKCDTKINDQPMLESGADCVFALSGNIWEIAIDASIMGQLIFIYDSQNGRYLQLKDETH
jgi:hypothetical protein